MNSDIFGLIGIEKNNLNRVVCVDQKQKIETSMNRVRRMKGC